MKHEEIIKQFKSRRREIVEQCIGCDYVEDVKYCAVYFFPEKKWKNGNCNLASHIEGVEKVETPFSRVGQQKQRMRKKKGV